MKNIPSFCTLLLCLLLTQSCIDKHPNKAINQQQTEKKLNQERLEAINNQLLSEKNCIIYDSTQVFKSLEDFLTLERFKGKVVYLDFWGIGCKPCLNEFAYLPELKKNSRANLLNIYTSPLIEKMNRIYLMQRYGEQELKNIN